MNYLKLIAIILIVLVVINIILFAFQKIGQLTFWFVILASALLAYIGIPRWKEKKEAETEKQTENQ